MPLTHQTCLQEALTSTYFLSWIPENLLTEKGPEEWDKFLKTEERLLGGDEDEGTTGPLPTIVDVVDGDLS